MGRGKDVDIHREQGPRNDSTNARVAGTNYAKWVFYIDSAIKLLLIFM